MVDGSVVWALIGSVVLVLFAGLVVHVVPEYERIVVTRLGRVVRVDGPGLTFRAPGLERTTTVSLRPRELQIVVSTTTRDGISVRLLAHVVCRVTEPSRSVTVVPDALGATFDLLESRLHTMVTQSDIWSLIPLRTSLETDFPAAASEVTATWGVEVVEMKLLDIEALINGNLLRSLRRLPAPALNRMGPPAANRVAALRNSPVMSGRTAVIRTQ